jgi:hypothetical protein
VTGVGRRIDVGWIKSVEEVWPGDIRTNQRLAKTPKLNDLYKEIVLQRILS